MTDKNKPEDRLFEELSRLMRSDLLNNLPPARVQQSSHVPPGTAYRLSGLYSGDMLLVPNGVDFEYGPPADVEQESYDAGAVERLIQAAKEWQSASVYEQHAREEMFKAIEEVEKSKQVSSRKVRRYWSQRQL